MNLFNIRFLLIAVIVCFTVSFPASAGAQNSNLLYSASFAEPDLDDLLAPIALYPDPLLSQMLPASTYPAEVLDAAGWLKRGGNVSNIDDQNWDDSVKAVTRYPDVLNMMADNMDWTANLGDAFINQPEDVARSIQRLRWQANDMGNLASNDRQDVNIYEKNIEIIPSQPQFFYVPIYDPVVVYVRRHEPSSVPFIFFGPPLLLGGWLIMDFDWGHHQVVYHGWNRPGWVNHARPYVHVKNVYVQGSRPFLHQRWRHDSSRGNPARYLASRPSGPHAARHALTGEIRGNHTVSPRPVRNMFAPGVNARAYSNRGRESRGTVNQLPAPQVPGVAGRPLSSSATREQRVIPTPTVSQRPTIPSPGISERRVASAPVIVQKTPAPPPASAVNKSRPAHKSVQPGGRPSGGFGGYRGAAETKTLSQRGQSSRQAIGSARSSPPSTPPVKHEGSPAGKSSSGDRQHR